jgi:hypothetical protein
VQSQCAAAFSTKQGPPSWQAGSRVSFNAWLGPEPEDLVVIAGLEEVDATGTNQVDDSVFLREAPGPRARWKVLERFRFANASKGIAEHRLDNSESTKRHLPVCFHPESEVLDELRLKDGQALCRTRGTRGVLTFCQGPVSRAVLQPRTWGSLGTGHAAGR